MNRSQRGCHKDPEQICNECRRWVKFATWPSRKEKKACLHALEKYIKFMQDGESVTQRHMKTGTSQQKVWVTTTDILELRVTLWLFGKHLRDPPRSSHCGG